MERNSLFRQNRLKGRWAIQLIEGAYSVYSPGKKVVSVVVIHYEEALYQVYAPLPFTL